MCNTETGRNRKELHSKRKSRSAALSRPEDIEAVNEVKPDYAGFVVEVPKSRRNVSVQQLRRPTALDHGIVSCRRSLSMPGGADRGSAAGCKRARDGSAVHGQEDASYVEAVKEQTGRPVVQAFSIRTQEDV